MSTAGSYQANEGDLIAGRYRLLRPIGAGAMGTVWAARHELLGREFALKLAMLSPRAGPEARARFLREAQIVGKLRHPNVVDVADVGDVGDGEGLYLAMELLEGKSLAERLSEHGPFEPQEALAIAGEVCRGLAAAHAAGVVHRDVKPENIFLSRGSSGGIVPKLLDFGISKGGESGEGLITLTGQLFGTPAYMSPEQALGELDIDHRTDLWSLGVVLYEMLTEQHPFAAESYPALLPLIAEKDFTPLPPTIPANVQAIVARCLAKSREDRYPSADALRADLDAARGAKVGPSVMPPNNVERQRTLPSLRPRAPLSESSEAPSASAPGRGMTTTTTMATMIAFGLALAVAIGAVVWRAYRHRRPPAPPPSPTLVMAPPVSAAPLVTPPLPPEAPPPLLQDNRADPAADAPAPEAATTRAPASPPPSTESQAKTRPLPAPPPPPPPPSTHARPPGSSKSVTKVDNAGF